MDGRAKLVLDFVADRERLFDDRSVDRDFREPPVHEGRLGFDRRDSNREGSVFERRQENRDRGSEVRPPETSQEFVSFGSLADIKPPRRYVR